jgi:cysteinyl-tRNA synthetase
LAGVLRQLGASLGLLERFPDEYFRGGEVLGIATPVIEKMIAERVHAKAIKDWAESDRIRDELAAHGIVLEDNPDGSTDYRQV